MYTDMPSSVVFSYATSKMNKPTLVADVAPAAEVMETDAIYKIQTANFVADGSNVYVAAMGYGELAAKTANGTQNVSFAMDGAGNNENGLILVKTGAADVVEVYNNAPTSLSTDYYNLIDKMDVTKPVLFIAGEKDPVGDFGKGVKAAFATFDKAGVKDLSCKLYPGLRHEILNEDCGKNVYEYIYDWLLERI